MARGPATDLPSGTLTFLLTDIEGSTRLWEEHPEEMSASLALHDGIVEQEVHRAGGSLVRTKGEGDSCFAVFERASGSIEAALRVQLRLRTEAGEMPLPLHVRIALHTGEAELRDGDYYGLEVNRCARLRAIAYGGQILLTGVTASLVRGSVPTGSTVVDLGVHRLKDLSAPEHVFQLSHSDIQEEFPPLLSIDARPNNLPLQLTSFVGREHDAAEIKRLLTTGRLLTLTGPGGAGKTRLALQLAAELAERSPDGVWLVELAPISDPDLVAQTAVNALKLPENPERTAAETLVERLRDRSLMLVLDNCEQVVGAVCTRVEGVLAGCPDVSVITTSRERIGARGESIYPVGPIAPQEAVDLFTDRARMVRPDFELSDENAPVVAEICRKVDALPLSIELAAARVRSLPPADILERLTDRFVLLKGTGRARIGRHESLGAAIDWSYSLLDETDQAVFRRLSAFVGGFGIRAAEAVCAGGGVEPDHVFDILVRLVDKSMVVAGEDIDGKARYRLLETTREFGRSEVIENAESLETRERHLRYYEDWCEEAADGLDGGEYLPWLDRLGQDIGNVRAALTFAFENERPDDVVQVVGALGEYWYARSLREGHEWLDRVWSDEIAHTPRAMRAAGWGAQHAMHAGDLDSAVRLGDAAVDIARDLGNPRWLSQVLNSSVGVRMNLRDATARELAAESLELARATEDPLIVCRALISSTAVELDLDSLGRARQLADEALDLARGYGSQRDLVQVLILTAHLHLRQGEVALARQIIDEFMALALHAHDPYGLGDALSLIARLAAHAGRSERAVRLVAAGFRSWDDAMGTPSPNDIRGMELWLEPIRAELGNEAVERIWQDGYAMTREQALAFAANEEAEVRPRGSLTNREMEVAELLSEGLTNRQIADRLVLSERTIDAHLEHIRNKLGMRNRAQIATWVADQRVP